MIAAQRHLERDASGMMPPPTPAPWPPAVYALPDTIDAIEAGRGDGQQRLFPDQGDDTRQGRLARLMSITPIPQGE